MSKFRVTARHSPLPRKNLVVLADSQEQAIDGFLAANQKAVQSRKRSGAILAERIDLWEEDGGRDDLFVTDVSDSIATPDVGPDGRPVTAETASAEEQKPKKRPYNRKPRTAESASAARDAREALAGDDDDMPLPAGLTPLS